MIKEKKEAYFCDQSIIQSIVSILSMSQESRFTIFHCIFYFDCDATGSKLRESSFGGFDF